MVRNLVGIDPQNKLIAIGDTPTVNQPLFFCKRDAQSARDDLVRMIYDLKDDLTEPPKAALYHACVGRGQHMFGEIHAEMRLIREHLGDIPLAGFLVAGEIARDRLYGFTGVLTIFK
jgi:small ligand-binding sensory domain FIST